MDDEFVVKDNQLVMKGIKGIPEIFTAQYYQNKSYSFGYRPITKAVFAVEYELCGVNPGVSHFINILLFAISCTILLKLLIRILLNRTGPVFIFIIMVIWIIHPIHTEVVASLKNREELLYFIFALLSLNYFIKYVEKHKTIHFLLGLFLFALSFLTKQSAISFILITPFVLWYLFVKPEPFLQQIKNNLRVIISILFLLVVAYIIYKIPYWFFPADKLDLLSFENPLRYDHSRLAKLSLAAYTLLIDLKLMLIPHPLIFYYGQYTIPGVKITDFWVLFSLVLHALILMFTAGYIKNKGILIFGIMFYYLGILPFSNYFIEINGIVGERFLFAPSFGFIIAFTFILFKLTKTELNIRTLKPVTKSLKYTLLLIVIIFSVKTIARNTSWKNSLTLYRNDISYCENSVKVNDILAQELMDKVVRELPMRKPLQQIKPTLDSVIYLYNKTLRLFPENPKALNNIANIYMNFYNQPGSALGYLQKANKFKNNSFELAYNIAQCYEMLKQETNAATWYNKATYIDPNYVKTWYNLINLYYKTGMPDSAKKSCERMMEHDTTTEIPYVGMGYYFILKKDSATAVKWWEKAFTKNQQNSDRAMSLANYFKAKKDTVKANFYFRKAIEAKNNGQK